MRAVPVQTMVEAHIVSDQHNASRQHLHGEIERMKTGIAAPSDGADPHKLQLVAVLVDTDFLNIPWPIRRLAIDGQL